MLKTNRGGRGKRSEFPTVPRRIPAKLVPLITRASLVLFKTGVVPSLLPDRTELEQKLTPLVKSRAIRGKTAMQEILDLIYSSK